MSSDDIEPAEPTWRGPRRWPFGLLALAILLVLTLAWAGTYASAVWFNSVGYGDVYGTLVLTKAALFGGTALSVAGAMAGSILVAARHRPTELAGGAWVERYRAYAEPVRLWIWICLTTIASLALATAEIGRWRDVLLWWQGGSFGTRDPWFHHDLGFYVFTLPWAHDVVDLGLTLGLLALATTVAAHYFYGGISISPAPSWTRAAQRQVTVLAAITLVFKAASYWLARYDAVHAGGPYATGLAYVDQHAAVPGREILTYASLICAALLAWQWRRPRWRVPAVAVILLFFSSVTLTLIWPAILQSTVVRANPIAYEQENLTASIAATRAAYGLDGLTVAPMAGSASALGTVPILDPAKVSAEIRADGAVAVSDPELDRYTVDGASRPVLSALAERGGVGSLIAAYADARDRKGAPRLLTSWAQDEVTHDLAASVAGPLVLGPNVVGGVFHEGSVPGVQLTPLNRIAYALANGNLDLLDKQGTLAMRLDPLQRASRIAPWLQLDRHPYLTVADGRALWVIDGYTVTGAYPGSAVDSWSGMTGDGSPGSSSPYDTVNYVRDAVKITVDAQSGAVRLYEWDSDPILRAWEGVFPGLVHSRSEIPPALLPHLRYPTDLFSAQRFQAQTYATATPESLLAFQQTEIPTAGDGSALAAPQRAYVGGAWSIESPMAASNGRDLAAVLVANSDATSPDYGQLSWLTTSKTVAGPATVNAIMRADPHVRALITALPTSSTAQWGPLVLTPTASGPVWAAPLYGVSTDTTRVPALAGIVVSVGDAVGVGSTVPQAIALATASGVNRAPTAAALIREADVLLARSHDDTLSPADRDALVQQAEAKLNAAAAVLAATK